MTSTSPAAQPNESNEARNSRLRPGEIIKLSAMIALFVGLTALLATHSPVWALIGFGVALVLSLVIVSLLMLAIKPDAFEPTEAHRPMGADGTTGNKA